ncbi:hypothetical protein ACFLR2_00480 [Chlamydiota bacterium]
MKKLWISLITLTASASLYALPVGNPWEASLHKDGIFLEGDCPSYWDNCSRWCEAWSFRLGFYGDFVVDRHMQINTRESNAHLHDTAINTEAAYLVVNAWNRIDFFSTLGCTSIRFEAPQITFGNPIFPNNYTVVETDKDFSWSLGVRATLWECGCFAVGGEAQYLYSRPHINFAHNAGLQNLFYEPNNVFIKYREWQVGLGAAYRINIICEATALIPYFAIRAGRATMTMDTISIPTANGGRDTFFNMECDDDWGYAVGVTLLGCSKISVTAEARFVTEKAFYINSQFRF